MQTYSSVFFCARDGTYSIREIGTPFGERNFFRADEHFAPAPQYPGQMPTNLHELILAGAIVGAPAMED